MKMISIRR